VLSINDTVRNFSDTYGYDDLHRFTRESANGLFRQAESRDIQHLYEGSEIHGGSRVVTPPNCHWFIGVHWARTKSYEIDILIEKLYGPF
jgi:hypothetical protein